MKSESGPEKTSYGAVWAGKFRPMYALFAGNDTVPISMWGGGGIRSIECRHLYVSNT